MPNFSDPRYWDAEYGSQGPLADYDWLCDFKHIQANLLQMLAQDCRILQVGCGNSRLGEDLYDIGQTDIVNIDFSPVVVEQMSERAKGERRNVSRFQHKLMGLTDLKFPKESFDFVLDKATLDCLMAGKATSNKAVPRALQEVHRVLKPGGVYFCVSHAAPALRFPVWRAARLAWRVTCLQVVKPGQLNAMEGEDKYHYIYVCRKAGEEARIITLDLRHRGRVFDVTFMGTPAAAQGGGAGGKGDVQADGKGGKVGGEAGGGKAGRKKAAGGGGGGGAKKGAPKTSVAGDADDADLFELHFGDFEILGPAAKYAFAACKWTGEEETLPPALPILPKPTPPPQEGGGEKRAKDAKGSEKAKAEGGASVVGAAAGAGKNEDDGETKQGGESES
eukprot:g215.t1